MIKSKKYNGNTILIVMICLAVVIALVGFLIMRQRIKNPAPTPAQTNSDSSSSDDQTALTPPPPPPPPSQIAGWQTYTNTKYDYSVQYPANLKVGSVSSNSVLGTFSAPVKGFHVGPLVFITLTGTLRKDGGDYFNESYNLAQHPAPATPGEPTETCSVDTINNPNVTVKSVSCQGEGGPAKYALIIGKDFDIFVDGYSKGFDKADNGDLKAVSDYSNILSTFKFNASATAASDKKVVTPTDAPAPVPPPPPAGGPTPAPKPTPAPTPAQTPPPPPTIQSFTITADDSQATPSEIKVTAGAIVEITFTVSAANVYYGGLDFRSATVNSGTIHSGESKTISFKADKSFSFTPYWPASQVAKPYTIKVTVQ